MDLKTMAKNAAQMKVHTMPSPTPPKKGKGNAHVAYDSAEYMKEKPRLRLNSVQMPGIKGAKDMEVGHECVMMVKAKMTGYNEDEYMKGEAEATFEILEIAMPQDEK